MDESKPTGAPDDRGTPRDPKPTLAVASGYHAGPTAVSGYHPGSMAVSGYYPGSQASPSPGLYAWGPEQKRLARRGWGPGPVATPQAIGDDGGEALRVVHVGPCLMRGGAEQWLVELTRFLDPGRVRIVRSIATEPAGIDPTFASSLPMPYEHGGAESILRAAEDADIVLCWGVALDELFNGRKPDLCVFVAHGDGPYTKDLIRKSARHADHWVAVSHRVRETSCHGLPTTVIYNGIDAARLARTRPRDEVRRQFGFGPEDFVLGYLGRFSGEKRVHLLIEAAAALPAEVKVLLVGWGPLLGPLMERANRLIPGRFAFVTAGGYLGDYYSAMDAFGLLGSEEGFSLAMLEAMMCGVPLIVTPVGAVPELIVDRVNGLVVAPEAAAVKEAADRLRRHPAWARGMAEEAKRFADREGHAVRMAREYEDLLERLWDEKRRADAHPPAPLENGYGPYPPSRARS